MTTAGQQNFRRRAFYVLMALSMVACVFPFVTPPLALAAGVFITLAFGNPQQEACMKAAHRILAFSVAGLGAGMNLMDVLSAGVAGMGYTFIGIVATLLMGFFLAQLLRAERHTAFLVSVGTAICGGSAIAATAPVIRAKQESIAVAFAVVFLLNALALLIFPPLGTYFDLTQAQFGLWAALAIHDTSSVVGAASAYGAEALDHAVILKMARALWIFPLALAVGFVMSRRAQGAAGQAQMKFPWFIPAFIIVAALFTFWPAWAGVGEGVQFVARRGMCVTLLLIGSTISLAALKSVGFRPLALGLLLWFFAAAGSLAVIRAGWIG